MGNAKAKDLKVSLFNGITYKSKTINVEVDGKTTIFLTLLAISIFHPELLELAIALVSRF